MHDSIDSNTRIENSSPPGSRRKLIHGIYAAAFPF